MSKDFNSWNLEKQNLESAGPNDVIFHKGEIWWCSIGVNIGSEQDGKNKLYERPVLVLRKFNNRMAWVLPMTTKNREGDYYHQLDHNGVISSAILSQLKLVSVKRFRRFVRKISQHQFSIIQDKIIKLVKP